MSSSQIALPAIKMIIGEWYIDELTMEPELSLRELDRGSLPEKAAATLASYGLVATMNCETLQVAVESFRLCDVERLPK